MPDLLLDRIDSIVPSWPSGRSVPRIVHQTYPTKTLPEALAANIERMRADNPGWEFRLYDDADILAFIRAHYGPDVCALYERIGPSYGAARADLFRYLLIYREGGVYLDIKSTARAPLEGLIRPDGAMVLAQWARGPGRQKWGVHRELRHIAGGEYLQWFLVASPGHPVMRHVVVCVLRNIAGYRPWRTGAGLRGVLRTTGPIAFTLAIESAPDRSRCVHVPTESELGLDYSVVGDHKRLFRKHYTRATAPVVLPRGAQVLPAAAHHAASWAWFQSRALLKRVLVSTHLLRR